MKAIEIVDFLLGTSPWIDRNNTVDRVIAGNPQKDIRRVLVTWMPSLAAVQHAISNRYDLLLTHEPTFYDHWDYKTNPAQLETVPTAKAKKKLIDDSGLAIIRCHDVWDLMPEIGVPFAWAKFLGITSKPVQLNAGKYQHRYDIDPMPLDDFARQVARRCAELGEPVIQVHGDGGRIVSKIGIGTGCCTQPVHFQKMGCDVSIVSDDGTWYWKQLQQAADESHPFIRVHHGTSEEPGMVTLTQFVNDKLSPELHADHLPHRPLFRSITA